LEGDKRSPVQGPSAPKNSTQQIKRHPAMNKTGPSTKPNQKPPGISVVNPQYVKALIEEALANPTGPNTPSQTSIPKFPTIRKPENYPPPLPAINDKSIEQLCFTHRSYSHDPNNKDITAHTMNYERLEFLGDSYMNYCVTKILYKRLPNLREGELTNFRSQLVSNENIRHYAMMYGFKGRILLGSGAEKDEVRAEGKAIADVFEAYIGGILTDQPDKGEQVVYKWMSEVTAPQVSETEKIAAKLVTLNKNAKQELYVVLDAQKLPAPVYVMTKQGSTTLDFEVACLVQGMEVGRGVGKNKNDAGTRAAMQALEKLRAFRAVKGISEGGDHGNEGKEKDKNVGRGEMGGKIVEQEFDKSSSLEDDDSDNYSLSEGEIVLSD
jgi:dsRNA-specific ribonuclease